MKLYEKFLEDSFTLRQLLDTYLELRQHFQELGFSEDQLEKPPHYTRKMMNLFHKFDNDGDVSNREAAQASAGAVDCGRLISARYGDEST